VIPDFSGSERFQIQRKLGAGGMGIVYEALDRERGARVALKTLARLDPAALYRFKREFRSLADVTHENLVELHELMSTGSQWFFTMELIAGVDFLSYVWGKTATALPYVSPYTATQFDEEGVASGERQRERPSVDPEALDLDRLRAAGRQLVAGVLALHEAGMLHRDIKPSNVLVNEQGRVVLLDFGIATEISGRPDQAETSILIGTPAYMSPEQGAALPLTAAADWYSVGVVLFEALTGRLPFDGSPLQMLMDKQRKEAPRVRSLREYVPEDLDALCAELLRGKPEERPSGREILKRLGAVDGVESRPSGPQMVASSVRASSFVGREGALRLLGEAFHATAEGRPSIALVHGRSGMGKSTLVRHFLDVVTPSDSRRDAIGDPPSGEPRGEAVVLVGRCYERESVPYKAFDSVVDALCRYLMELPREECASLVPEDASLLARLFPVLQRVPAIAEAPRRAFEIPDPQQLRMRAFGALREILVRLGARAPLVVFIDDLQWGDADSAALLAELTAAPDAPAMLVILGYRAEDEDSAILRDVRTRIAHRAENAAFSIAVEALSQENARKLAAMLLGDRPDDDPVADEVARESGGSPFFIGELVRYVQSDAAPHSTMGVRLERVLRDRLLALPDPAQRLLRSVGVAGRPIRLELAYAVADLGVDERSQALASLRVGHLVRTTGVRAVDLVEPYHDRIRETAVSLLDEAPLREVHGRLAAALEKTGGADPETLYVHHRGAGDHARALEYAETAAEKAARALAFDRAAELYRLALETMALLSDGRDPNDKRRHALQLRLAEALVNGGRGADAAKAYVEATKGAQPSERHDLERKAAEQLLCAGHIDEGLELIVKVLAQVGLKLPPTTTRAIIWLLLIRLWIWIRGLDFEERDASQVDVRDLARLDTCASLAVGLSFSDTFVGAAFQAKALHLALRAGEPSRLSRALAWNSGIVGCEGGKTYAKAMEMHTLARRLATKVKDDDNDALIEGSAGMIAYFNGRWREAAAQFAKAADLHQRAFASWTRYELDTTEYYEICALAYLGRLAEATRRMPACRRNAEERGDQYFACMLVVGETNLTSVAADETIGAREAIAEHMSRWSRKSFQTQHFFEMQALTYLDLYDGKGRDALERLDRQWKALARSFILSVQVGKGMTHYLRACAALSAAAEKPSDLEALIDRARRDRRVLVRQNMPWIDPLARVIEAGIAAHARDDSSVVAALQQAVIGFDSADMSLWAAAAKRRLGARMGGDRGKELVREGDHALEAEGVKNPARWTGMLLPGLD